MDAPKYITNWIGANYVCKKMVDSGFKLSDRFITYTADLLNVERSRWRRELNGYATERVRCCRRIAEFPACKTVWDDLMKRIVFEAGMRDEYNQSKANWLREEMRPRPDIIKGWEKGRAHIIQVFKMLGKEHGYRMRSNGYVIDLGGKGELVVEVDPGRRESADQQILMYLDVVSSTLGFSMYVPIYDIMPGFGMYTLGAGIEEMAWCVESHFAVSRIIAESFFKSM